ncbi:hypothetical protein DM01DRAFT_1385950 [Hesseltinella vesiculosa]|uniref:Uncharacterized protein n=1 Tax=Hesseltinella vesiculosa TaxID=101127 RepID=A0A1X2G7R6_9FUNG|nr:hypothetical protein DM01DRAFT_1385950 [Hesseltinella vesiculosa]
MPISYDFEAPGNLTAIRCKLQRRIYHQKQQRQKYNDALLQQQDTLSQTTYLSHGLPSPPVEYHKKKSSECSSEDDDLSTISSLPPPNCASTAFHGASTWSTQQLEAKLADLKQEKHRLFAQMKQLLQDQPSVKKPSSPLLPSPSPSPTTTPHLFAEKDSHPWKRPTSPPPSRPRPFPQHLDRRVRYLHYPTTPSSLPRRHSYMLPRSNHSHPIPRSSRYRPMRLSFTEPNARF